MWISDVKDFWAFTHSEYTFYSGVKSCNNGASSAHPAEHNHWGYTYSLSIESFHWFSWMQTFHQLLIIQLMSAWSLTGSTQSFFFHTTHLKHLILIYIKQNKKSGTPHISNDIIVVYCCKHKKTCEKTNKRFSFLQNAINSPYWSCKLRPKC